MSTQAQLTHVRGTVAHTAQLPSTGVCLALEKHLAVWRSVQVRPDLRGGLSVLPLSLQKHFLQTQGLSVLRCFAQVAGRRMWKLVLLHILAGFSERGTLASETLPLMRCQMVWDLHDARQAAVQMPVHVN